MGEIREYKCTYSNSVGISAEVTAGLGLEFPDAYMHSETMQVLARAIKEHDNADFCLLPFCRTVEAEAMGAVLNYGDANTGPRAKDPICETCDDVLALPAADVTKGRMAEVIDACRALKEQGETVCLEVTGPFTILQALMEPRKVFRAYRKDHDGIVKVMSKLSDDLLIAFELVIRLECQRTGACDGTEVLFELLLGHADAVIRDGDGSCVLIQIDTDREVVLAHAYGIVRQGTEVQLVDRIRCIGDQLTQEDLLMRVDRVDHHVEQLFGFCLKCLCFHTNILFL